MSITIRRADLARDGAVLLRTYRSYLNPLYDAARFDWMYGRNPHGAPAAWLAMDGDEVVGAAGAFPRRLRTPHASFDAWVLGDICVADSHRTLGPAVMLQRACLAAVDAGEATLCYDFPSARMLAVYARLGMAPLVDVIRLARPLRVDHQVRRRVRHAAVARGVSSVGNLVLRLGTRRLATHGVDITVHQGVCGQEFSALDRELGDDGVAVERSAEYVNWRWLANPLARHDLIVARRHGRLRGWAVVAAGEQRATIADMLAGEPGIAAALVESAVAHGRAAGAVSLSMPASDHHPWRPLLRDLGFRAREAAPVVVYEPGPDRPGRLSNRAWRLVSGDADS